MNLFRSRPTLRWLVPTAAAVVVVGGGAAAGTIVANADPGLPPRSAAQLLVDVQTAKVDGFSGTIVQTADLGLPALSGITTGQGDADLTKLITGSNTAKVWYAGTDRVRVALMGVLGETDMVRNGTDVWLWRSRDNTATHLSVPAGSPEAVAPSGFTPPTPQEAADAALKAIGPTTTVSTTGQARVVAGRDAYELVLAPKDSASLIGQVRLAIDAKSHLPLRVDVYAKNANDPAFRVAFQDISFTVPDARQFTFNPPPHAKVDTATPEQLRTEVTRGHAKLAERVKAARATAEAQVKADPNAAPKVVGTGWTAVLTLKMPTRASDAKAPATDAQLGSTIAAILGGLPKVSGSWGSGRLLSGALFSVLLTDDGRVLAGAVTPQRLYEVAASK